MPAYVIVDVEITDPDTYKEYMALTPAVIAAYGGRYLARGGWTEAFEGDWKPSRLVILEFQSLDRARAWLDSPEYKPIKALRHKAARTRMVAIEGV